MEIRWLEGFVAVAEEMHFGRAAARLHMAQSPLSQLIRRLEQELGTPLFTRSTRSVALTASGQVLLPYAYRVLKDLRIAADAALSAEGVLTGRLDVGFSGVHNHQTLPLLARALRRECPGIELNLVGGVRTFDGVKRVRNGELDLAFIGLIGELDAPLEYRAVSRQRLGVVLPSDHRLALRSAIPMAELRSEPFVMGPVDGNSSLTVVALRTCQNAGFMPQVAQVVSDPYLILSLVAAGVGAALMTSEVLPVLPSSAVWVEIEGAPIEFLHALVWSTENDSPGLRATLEVVDAVFPRLE
ncbi:LysR substrate-binding domain-containing protein [Leucobacter sp. NPDC058333]|uniref:LysR substrate-binding domain-containing protein n=1 Tax=Leucobacter sp. NPDC058333 TaxID=3346450 RepID=UPI0036660902